MTTIDTTDGRDRVKISGRHPVNIGHLVMGIAFLGIVVVWILIESDAVTGDDIRWLLPVPWVLAGAAGLLATTRRRHDSEEWRGAAYHDSRTGWVGNEPTASVEESGHVHPAYDDLDEKLARAERETVERQSSTVAPPEPVEPAEPTEPADPVDPTDPDDPVDPEDPVDPVDPADEKEHDR